MQQRPSFESLFRLSPNAYVLLDPELVILDANLAYLTLTGRSLDDLLGQRLHEAFEANPQQSEATHVQQLLDSFARVLSRKAVDALPTIRYPIVRETPFGRVYEDRHWSATHVPVFDSRGEIMAILQHTVDVTELQTMKETLRDSFAGSQPLQHIEGMVSRARLLQDEGEQLRRLFAQAPGFICFLRGPEHVFGQVNDAYQQLTGHRQLIGKTVREGLPEVEGQAFLGLLDHVYETAEPFLGKRMSAVLQRRPAAEPEEVFIDFIYQPIIDADGQVSGIFVQGNDVTEQQRNEQELSDYRQHLEDLVRERTRELLRSETERHTAEAALLEAQKLEAVGKLTGGIAHDFNNMLQIIGGNLQLLRRNLGGDETAIRRLEAAVSGVEQGARLATQLLAFASRQPLRPQAVHLGELLEQMKDLLGGSLGHAARVELDIEDPLWPVFADIGNLQSVIVNLVTNARDAMSSGGRLLIRVRNRTLDAVQLAERADTEAGDFVLLSVIDEGAGMSADVRTRAFEPFFTTKQASSSSGLGLSMVYGFVKQSGGFVSLESEEQGGTSVHIHLPRCPDTARGDELAQARPAQSSPATQSEPPLERGSHSQSVPSCEPAGLNILFVEDDPTLRMLTGEVMVELGHHVSLSESAEDALERLESQVFDVLLTDVGLAGMSGIELVRQAKARVANLDIVIASGYAVAVDEEGLEAVHTMLKPYDIHQVRELLAFIQAERKAAARP